MILLFSTSVSCLQKAPDALQCYCHATSLTVSMQKTETMKLKKKVYIWVVLAHGLSTLLV